MRWIISNHIFWEWDQQRLNTGLLNNEKSNQFSIFGLTPRQFKVSDACWMTALTVISWHVTGNVIKKGQINTTFLKKHILWCQTWSLTYIFGP